jgi:hypothetical protein
MATITLTSNGRGYSHSCSEGGGAANASSSSSFFYIGGYLYCSFMPFANIPNALGSTGPGSIKIKKATLVLRKVESYNSSTGNSSTGALRFGVGTKGSSTGTSWLVKKTTNIYSSAKVYGPEKAYSYFSSTTRTVTKTNKEIDYTAQVQAILDNRNTAGGTLNFHNGGTTYILICDN